jgi:hypothetical protein
VYVYMYGCVYVYTCMFMYINGCVHMFLFVCVYIYTHAHTQYQRLKGAGLGNRNAHSTRNTHTVPEAEWRRPGRSKTCCAHWRPSSTGHQLPRPAPSDLPAVPCREISVFIHRNIHFHIHTWTKTQTQMSGPMAPFRCVV